MARVRSFKMMIAPTHPPGFFLCFIKPHQLAPFFSFYAYMPKTAGYWKWCFYWHWSGKAWGHLEWDKRTALGPYLEELIFVFNLQQMSHSFKTKQNTTNPAMLVLTLQVTPSLSPTVSSIK